MPKITSNLEHTKAFSAVPDNWYLGKLAANPPLETPKEGEEAGAYQLNCTWEIIRDDKGDTTFAGRKIQYDRVIVGGKNPKTGEDYGLNRMLMFIGALGITWDCKLCGAANTAAPVKDGLDYKCPACEAILMGVDFVSEDSMNKQCLIKVTKKQRMAKPDFKKAALDEDGKPIFDNSIAVYKNVDAA